MVRFIFLSAFLTLACYNIAYDARLDELWFANEV